MKKIETFEELSELSTGLNVIKFYADWCGPCRSFSPIMENVSQNIEEVNFFSVDVDESGFLAEKFGVNSIPSLVIVKNGKVVDSFTGIRNAKDVSQLINKYKN
jgi:thioredoxin 1